MKNYRLIPENITDDMIYCPRILDPSFWKVKNTDFTISDDLTFIFYNDFYINYEGIFFKHGNMDFLTAQKIYNTEIPKLLELGIIEEINV